MQNEPNSAQLTERSVRRAPAQNEPNSAQIIERIARVAHVQNEANSAQIAVRSASHAPAQNEPTVSRIRASVHSNIRRAKRTQTCAAARKPRPGQEMGRVRAAGAAQS